MNYWIFIVSNQNTDQGPLTGRQIYETRMGDRFWGLGPRTPNRRHLKKGDSVLFYVGMPEGAFAGTARLASDSYELGKAERRALSRGSSFFSPQYGVQLEEIDIWERPKSVKLLAPHLSFIENPNQWGLYLQGGIRQIEGTDFEFAVSASEGRVEPPSGEAPVAQPSFELESHLEDFLEHNWQSIAWGAPLELYEDEERRGRQFPAGTWSIDFLARDRAKKELVVIELKRKQGSDSTVGQVLRYMNWVRENIATPGQRVRGIIVVPSVDESLRYAVRNLPDVEVRTYEVRFDLRSFESN
jgi:hypothetical protein